MKRILVTLLLLPFYLLVFGQNEIIDKIKKQFPDAQVIELDKNHHYQGEYLIKINQRVNHKKKRDGYFQQRIFLSHFSENAPMLYVTEGYTAGPRHYELSEILRSNQMIVEFRYNGGSVPKNKDFQFLTNEQAVKDLHMIRKKMGKIYKGEWVSTGISKGGTTCLMYKAMYPKDVEVAIPYVAPLPDAREDRRMDSLILNVGEKECRDLLANFQTQALLHRDSIVPMMEAFAEENQLTFERVNDVETAFEYAVLEFTFSFWQMGHDCNRIPEKPTSKELYDLLMEIVGLDFYSDATIDYFEPAFYQFLTQNGYYGFIYEHVDSLLNKLTVFDNEIFGPRNVSLAYNPEFVEKVRKKLDKHIDQTIQIQGEYDPWAAAGYIPPEDADALYMVKEKGSHLTRIKDLSLEQQTEIYNALNRWLETNVYPLESYLIEKNKQKVEKEKATKRS